MPKKLPQFQRARKPEQIEKRREDILRAALKLFVEQGFENVSLNEIAREVACAKSNIYHYFESREHIYLILLQREGDAWEERVTPALERIDGKGTIKKVTDVIVSSFIESPRYCLLICVINSVLEKNLSSNLVLDFRTAFYDRRERFAQLIASALPGSRVEKISPVMLCLFAAVSGVWPVSHPPQKSTTFLNERQFLHLKVIFEKEMTVFIKTLLEGALS